MRLREVVWLPGKEYWQENLEECEGDHAEQQGHYSSDSEEFSEVFKKEDEMRFQ